MASAWEIHFSTPPLISGLASPSNEEPPPLWMWADYSVGKRVWQTLFVPQNEFVSLLAAICEAWSFSKSPQDSSTGRNVLR